jgi:acyl-CoA synthetase (AMP-forming)/AMP-acid ligase II
MVSNVSFALLDTAVIAGRGEDPVVGTMTHARLLEEVAAIGGVLRHLGAVPGAPVVVDLQGDQDAVVAALAAARIGAVVTTVDDSAAPVAVVSAGSSVSAEGRHRLVRGDQVTEPDLDWNVMLRAGRTDPAAVEVLEPEAAYSPERSVAEQLEILASTSAPYDAGELRRLLGV